MRSFALWLGLTAVYAAAVLVGGADAAPPVPWAVERLRDAVGTLPLQLAGGALTAAAFTALAGTARRTIADPWATATTLAVALSPPALECATAIGADPWAAACLAGGVALTARALGPEGTAATTAGRAVARRGAGLAAGGHPDAPAGGSGEFAGAGRALRRRDALAAAGLLALVPWFGVWHAVAALLVLAVLVRATLRRRRAVLALVCAEIGLASGVSLYEVGLPAGPPAAAGDGPLPLLAVLLDRGDGVLRWAPVLVLGLVGAFWLWRSVRDGVVRLVPDRAAVEATGLLTGAVCVATVAASAFGGVSPLPALAVAVPLVAWGARRAPRVAVVLGAVTLAGSVWAAVAIATGAAAGWTGPGLTAPWGPLAAAFPDVAAGGWWPATLGAALLAALLAVALVEWRAREATLDAAATGRR